MNIVEVVPIAKSVHRESLSYFTGKNVKPGALVTVSLRGKKISGIAVSTESAALSKSGVKSSLFKLKKIEGVKADEFLREELMDACRKTAEYFAARTGQVLRVFLPKVLEDASLKSGWPGGGTKVGGKSSGEKFLLQAGEEERFSVYKNIIREEFARKKSVFLCLPEIFEAEKYARTLEKGIKEYSFILHGGLGKKEAANNLQRIAGEKHPVLIIGTGAFLSVLRSDLGTIILDRESSGGYKTVGRPFIDIRKFAEFLAEKLGIRLIFGDIAMRAETIFRKEKGEFLELIPLKFRAEGPAESAIADLKTAQNGEYKILSDELKNLIFESRSCIGPACAGGRVFVLANRRGLSPLTVCSDCGSIESCRDCGTPLVLHKKTSGGKESRSFICHKCGKSREASDKCRVCGGWKFKLLGVGIEQMTEEIKKEFPELKVFRLDGDTAKTDKKAREIAERFYGETNAVLVGTVKAIPYLHEKIYAVAAGAIDGMLGVPDFRMNEKIFNLLLRLRRLAEKKFMVQTRKIENKVFEYAAKGDLINFYREEIAERQTFNYPPFSIIVKASIRGKAAELGKETAKIAEVFGEWSPEVFPAFIPMKKGLYRTNVVMKLPREKWVDRELLEKLLSLPPQVEVKVDPEDIL